MKEKSLIIKKEDAIKLYLNSSDEMKLIFENTFGKDFYKIDITTDITTKVFDLNSLINHLGYNPIIFHGTDLDDYKKYINACAVIAKVADLYNEGFVFDWKNNNQHKWIPYKYISVGGSVLVRFNLPVFSFHGSGFCYFNSEDRAKKAYNNFKSFYEDFWNIK